jgi:putative membrane protein
LTDREDNQDNERAGLASPEPATPAQGSRRYPYVLLALFAVVFAVGAIRPVDYKDWALENALAVAFVAVLVLTRKRLPLSNVSYTVIFLFLCLHTLGAHYTYSLVPYDHWSRELAGQGINETFGWQRNHFDRLVHFCFGFLLAYPIREIFLRVAGVRGFWGYYLPLDVAMSFSMLYELIEWAASLAFGGDLGQAYLGTQGDQWDAHKDMALATLGAVISMGVVAAINWRFDRRFGEEFRSSLSVKGREPLGEVRLRELARKRQGND